jgi:hypothetical protein
MPREAERPGIRITSGPLPRTATAIRFGLKGAAAAGAASSAAAADRAGAGGDS